jgi:serine/threonine protein kinase
MALQKLGPYRLVRLLGQGGMGAVYEGIDENSGQHVAVKALPATRSRDEVFAKRFGSEIATLIPLDHPNIVHILGHGRDQGHLFLAMELVDGPSLFDYFRKKRTLTWAEVVGYVLDICKGLKFAHDRGFIHRDLKLGNLLLDSKGQVKITDFGIARYGGVGRDELREAITQPGGVVGTLDYMAPEQLRGEAASVRSDLYSLGVVMYVLLTGRTPFSFRNVNEAIATIRTAEITPVGNLAPDLPPRLERIVMRLLEKDPTLRYGSAQAVAHRLIEIIDGDADAVPRSQRISNDSQDDQDDDSTDDTDDNDFHLLTDEIHVQRTEVAPIEPAPFRSKVDPPASDRTDVHRDSNPTLAKPLLIGDATLADPHEATRVQSRNKGDYFATVTDEERKADAWRTENEESGPIWPYFMGLSVVLMILLGGLYFSLFRAPSADRLHADISAMIAEGKDPLELEDRLSNFVERFPDDERSAAFQSALDELEAQRLPRRLERDLRWRGPASLTEPERQLLDALRLAETRPEEADRNLAALYELVGVMPDAETESLREAIEVHRRVLAEILTEQLVSRRREIQFLIDVPLPTTDADRSDLLKQVEAVLLLYGDDSRLIEKLTQLRERVAELTAVSAEADDE